MEHKEIYLEINGKQSVKLKSGTMKFKNYFKQITVPFKIYADFESLLKGLQINLYVLTINLADQLFFTEEKMQPINLFKRFLKNIIIANK